MNIIRYRIAGDITVEFQDEHKYTVNTTYNNFNRKCISNPYDKTVCGVGYLGEGKYKTKVNGKNTRAFDVWYNMLARCYSEEKKDKFPAYYGICTVCKEWNNFQTFAKWYYDNFYDSGDGTRMHIDKDILINGNKEYAPDKCVFVPQRINMIFMTKARIYDKDLPNAIHRCATGFQSYYKGKLLGTFETLDEAVNEHDKNKRIHIKRVANEYRGRIPEYIYEALLRW